MICSAHLRRLSLLTLMCRISPRVPFARFHVYSRLYFSLNTSNLRLGFPKACNSFLSKSNKRSNHVRTVVSSLFIFLPDSISANRFVHRFVMGSGSTNNHFGDLFLTFFGYRSLIDFGIHFGWVLVPFWSLFGSFRFPMASFDPFPFSLVSLWQTSHSLGVPSLVGYRLMYFGSNFMTFHVRGFHFPHLRTNS